MKVSTVVVMFIVMKIIILMICFGVDLRIFPVVCIFIYYFFLSFSSLKKDIKKYKKLSVLVFVVFQMADFYTPKQYVRLRVYTHKVLRDPLDCLSRGDC